MPRRTIPALLLASVTIALAGCGATVNVPAAPEANAAECADVMVRLPQSVDGAERRWTDSQSTAAWGDPATVIFSCGVATPGPTTLRCESVSGVDWVIDESEAPRFRVVSFGRTPAVELFFDTEVSDDVQGVSSRAVLDALSPIVSRLPRDGGECVDRAEATPVPSPVGR